MGIYFISFMVLFSICVSPVFAEVETFADLTNELMFGNLAWIFTFVILAIFTIVMVKVKALAVVGFVACFFLAFQYGTQNPQTLTTMWITVLYGVFALVCIFRLAGVWIFGD